MSPFGCDGRGWRCRRVGYAAHSQRHPNRFGLPEGARRRRARLAAALRVVHAEVGARHQARRASSRRSHSAIPNETDAPGGSAPTRRSTTSCAATSSAPGKQDRELVAADARDQVGRARICAPPRGDAAQQLVAGGVAAGGRSSPSARRRRTPRRSGSRACARRARSRGRAGRPSCAGSRARSARRCSRARSSSRRARRVRARCRSRFRAGRGRAPRPRRPRRARPSRP